MSSSGKVSVAAAAYEFTKMLLVVAANTTVRVATFSKSEMKNQYQVYQKRLSPQQLEALKLLTDWRGNKASLHSLQSVAKEKFNEAKDIIKDAKGKIEVQAKGKLQEAKEKIDEQGLKGKLQETKGKLEQQAKAKIDDAKKIVPATNKKDDKSKKQ